MIFFFLFWTLKATVKEVKYFKETSGWKSVCKSRAVLRTQSSIYMDFFAQMVNGFQLFLQKATS